MFYLKSFLRRLKTVELSAAAVTSASVAESQSRTVLSLDADAISFPSGENATCVTQSEWPLSVLLFQ